MKRVYVICEGATEEAFVSNVLRQHYGYPTRWDVKWIPVPVGKARGNPIGGDIRYKDRVKPDLIATLKQDRDCYVTTMFDYYRLGRDFPRDGNPALTPHEKARNIEQAVYRDISESLGNTYNASRFFPYIQMHEFEALLFSAPETFANAIYRSDLAAHFSGILTEFGGNPELINDGLETAPSKRVSACNPDYNKPIEGSLAAGAIGVSKMKEHCAHFAEWLVWLDRILNN